MITGKPARACLDCGRITTQHRDGRCPPCYATHRQQVDRARDQRRGTAAQRGYGYRWQNVVAKAIKQQPFCSVCGHAGSAENPLTGDHILPISKGGTWEPSNVRVLCRVHNSQKGAKG